MKHFGIYANSGDVNTALVEESLVKPYVALVSGALDYNTQEAAVDYSQMPLTLEFLEDGTITFSDAFSPFKYSVNDGEWVTVEVDEETGATVELSVSSGDTVALIATDNFTKDYGGLRFNAYGNFNSLACTALNEDFTTILDFTDRNKPSYVFSNVTASNVVDAENLVLPTTGFTDRYEYEYMFAGCTELVKAPRVLPATVLSEYCYNHMFDRCTALTQAPELPATTLAAGCYAAMFLMCSSLVSATVLPAPVLVDGCYSNMFVSCTGLTSVACLATSIAQDASPFGQTTMCEGDYWLSYTNWDGGTFYKAANTTIPWCVIPEDDSQYECTGYEVGPYTWTIQNYQG